MGYESANYEVLNLSGTMNLNPFDSNNFRTGYTFHEIRCISNGSITITPMLGDSFTWNGTVGLSLRVLVLSVVVNSGTFIALRARNERNPFYENTENSITPLQNPCFQGVVVYPDFASIPSGTITGEPAMVADNTNFAPFLYRSIYLWDGAVWNLMLELIFLDAPTFAIAVVNSQDADWEFQLNGGAWNDVNFPETNNVDVNFRQISTECVYENDPVVPS